MAFSATSFFLVCLFYVSNGLFTSWWSLGINEHYSLPRTYILPCNALADELKTPAQRTFCEYNAPTVDLIAKGIRTGIVSCQKSFHNSKWNCTTFDGDYLFGSFIVNNTRETAVVNSLLGAGAARKVAEACHDEKLQNCTCKVEGSSAIIDGNFFTYSCSYDGDAAKSISLQFLEGSLGSSLTDQVQLQNYKVGLNIVRDDRYLRCYCHGFSGTCSVQTCYYETKDMDTIGAKMRQLYSGAVRVNDYNSSSSTVVPADPNVNFNATTNLAYIENSPNMCNSDLSSGILGTSNRPCNSTTVEAVDSCESLCCGRGHYSVSEQVPVECCTFVYCCRIECKQCGTKTVQHSFCN